MKESHNAPDKIKIRGGRVNNLKIIWALMKNVAREMGVRTDVPLTHAMGIDTTNNTKSHEKINSSITAILFSSLFALLCTLYHFVTENNSLFPN